MSDPFEVPRELVEPGMSYQWCSRFVCGEPDPSFDRMVKAGWVAVSRQDGSQIELGGQALMCRPEVATAAARQEEMARVEGQIDFWIKHAMENGFSGYAFYGGGGRRFEPTPGTPEALRITFESEQEKDSPK